MSDKTNSLFFILILLYTHFFEEERELIPYLWENSEDMSPKGDNKARKNKKGSFVLIEKKQSHIFPLTFYLQRKGFGTT